MDLVESGGQPAFGVCHRCAAVCCHSSISLFRFSRQMNPKQASLKNENRPVYSQRNASGLFTLVVLRRETATTDDSNRDVASLCCGHVCDTLTPVTQICVCLLWTVEWRETGKPVIEREERTCTGHEFNLGRSRHISDVVIVC